MRNLKKLAAMMLALAITFALTVSAFAAVNDTGFSDVDADAWYAEAVMYCREHGLMNGTSSTTFDPDSSLTRAMMVTVLYRMAGSPDVSGTDAFSDTVEGSYYSDAVLWASQQDIVNGYGGGLFGTDDPVSREQIATILWRYAGRPAAEEAWNYADRAETSGYAVSAVDWAGSNGIMGTVSSNAFEPKSDATRAQTADAMMKYSRAQQTEPNPGTENKVLVAYFSGTGTTRGVAQNLAAALGSDVADLHEITPEEPYTAADLDYTNSNCRSVREQHDPNARPAISGSVENMEQYDVVFLGYPIWNNDAPRIIYTFLESEEFSGKTVVPFCTSGGSGISSSVSNIRGLAGDASWLDGRRCSSGDTVSTLSNWANSLGLDFTSGTTAPPNQEPQVLVAYFSATNTTEGVAQHIAYALDADLYEITSAVPYTSADLNYGDSNSRTTKEMNDPISRPEISGSVSNMEDYDIVFLG